MNDKSDWNEGFERHRAIYGAETLTRYYGLGRSFICKETDGRTAILVEIGSQEEIEVAYEEFKKTFFLTFMDWEPAFAFASEEQRVLLEAEHRKEVATIKYCLGV